VACWRVLCGAVVKAVVRAKGQKRNRQRKQTSSPKSPSKRHPSEEDDDTDKEHTNKRRKKEYRGLKLEGVTFIHCQVGDSERTRDGILLCSIITNAEIVDNICSRHLSYDKWKGLQRSGLILRHMAPIVLRSTIFPLSTRNARFTSRIKTISI
jgi:hypothetical protein